MLFSTQSHEVETSIRRHARSGAPTEVANGTQPPAEELDLAVLWAGIVKGTHFLVEGYYSADRCFLTVELRPGARPRRRPLRMALLERILLGESYKSVAIEQGLAVSTVALTCGECLRGIGRLHLPSRVPALLLMAVHAAHGVQLEPARMYRVRDGHREHWVITAERPDRVLPKQLTPAEADVIRSLVEGNTHEQIALVRSASRRTVANQLASAFRKMGVSGRAAMLSKLIRRASSVTSVTHVEANLSVAHANVESQVEAAECAATRAPCLLPKAARGRTLST